MLKKIPLVLTIFLAALTGVQEIAVGMTVNIAAVEHSEEVPEKEHAVNKTILQVRTITASVYKSEVVSTKTAIAPDLAHSPFVYSPPRFVRYRSLRY